MATEPTAFTEEAEVKTGFIKRVMNGLSTPFPEDSDKGLMTKEVIAIAWPAMAESFLLHFAGMANTMMVGGIGTWAISAVGYCTQPRQILLAVFQAFNIGATALIARSKGAGNQDEANRIMHQSLFFSLVLAVILAALGTVFATPMVVFMGANEPLTVTGATEYMRYIMISFPANAISLSITAVLRGIGKTRVSMIYNIVANVVNVGIGFFLINGRFGFPSLGVTGAAIGMCSGQITAMVISIAVLLRGADMLRLAPSRLFSVDFGILRRIARIGAPAMFNQFFIRFGNIMFTRVVSSLGTDVFATHQIANNILSMTMMNGQSFSVAATSLLGQSIGRKRVDMGKAYVQLCRRYAMFISLAMGASLILFGRQLAGMYTDVPAVISESAFMLVIVALVQPLHSSQQTLAGALRGAGDTKAIAYCTFLTTLIFRPGASWIMVNPLGLGLLGVWIALALDQVLRSCYTMWRFSSDRWKYLKV
jgi:putative MATE family efflux protein